MLFGEGRLDRMGNSIALSRDGTVLAAGAPGNNLGDNTFEGFGHVRIYKLFNWDWSQLGQDIDRKLYGGILGTSVSLSGDDDIVAVGSPGNGTGYTQVYMLQGTSWVQVGDGLEGEYGGEVFGTSVSLSSNAGMVAVGGPMNQEGRGNLGRHVHLYRLAR